MSQFIEMFGNPVTNTKGWKTAKIKDVAPEMPSKEQLSGKIWLLNLDMIESNTGRIIEKVYEDVENALSVQSFDEGNVLFSKLRPYLNKVVIPDEPGMATTELVPLRPEPSKLHKVFLSHLLRGNQFVNYANDIAGGTKMPRMPLTELRNFDCILPPMDKQLEFVFIAEQVDKSKFGDFKSQFIEMFKGDNQVPLGDICNIEKGATITRNDVLPGEVPVVAGGQEPSCYHNVANREAGAITVSASGAYAGYINFWNCPIFASDCNTIISKDDEKTDQTFVYFGLRAMQKQIYGLQKGGAQPHVYGKDLQKFMFPCPSYAKQIEFSKMAKQADKSKFELKQCIEHIDKVIKSLING